MLDKSIEAFFADRKEGWLKKNIKSSMTDEEIVTIRNQCDEVFSLENWLPNAAKRAGQITMATHPCTFSHPSARKNRNGYVTSVISTSTHSTDGFLRSGNVQVETDALGNAAALDVYKFLNLVLSDHKLLYEHIRTDSDIAKSILKVSSASYEELKSGFLTMTENSGDSLTSSKIKQVYFPVGKNYHLLSLVSNSGMIFSLRERLDLLRFSDEVKNLRDARYQNKFSEKCYLELFNITMVGYGGTKPQNISVLNNRFGGKAYLLQSTPPQVEKKKFRFPHNNFFGESFTFYDCKDIFDALHNILKTDYNNVHIREGRDFRIQELTDRVIHRMWIIRSISEESFQKSKPALSPHQTIWLSYSEKNTRETTDDWLDEIMKELSNWIVRTYRTKYGKQARIIGTQEQQQFYSIISKNKEALR